MIKEQLVQHATGIARAKACAVSGKPVSDLSQLRKEVGAGSDAVKRLATYHEAAKDEDPPCPECWMDRGEELAMAPMTIDTLDEVQFGCMECGFEASFPARTLRYWAHLDLHRKRSRAA